VAYLAHLHLPGITDVLSGRLVLICPLDCFLLVMISPRRMAS
jgi:hypothetical protein